MGLRKTPDVAKELGIKYSRLINWLRSNKLPRPEKDSSGDYLWMDADLDNARQVLLAARRDNT
jgi:hypothetical protein